METFTLPAHLEKFAGKAVPAPAKMMTAKGTAPLQPKDLITCVYAMTLEEDENLSKTALKSLEDFPETILNTAVSGGLHQAVMDCLVKTTKHQTIVEAITLHPNIANETLCHLAETGTTRVIDIIANNQTRLIKCPAILDSLGKNSLTSSAVIDRLLTFLEQQGVISTENVSEPELSVEEFIAQEGQFDVPEGLEFPTDLIDDLKEELPEEEVKNLFAKILSMSVMEKIKLAIKGNKEARSILVRDPNKLVSTAVVKSPKIGDNEVVSIVQSKTVSDQVLRNIYKKKEWRKIYKVQLGLASNPKTPPDIGIRMLKMLRESDLKTIEKSKSVPGAIRTTAKRMLMAKGK